MIRVLLADDHALMRGAVRVLLDTQDDMVVVGEAGDGEEAIAVALETRPDVVLMDIGMPRVNGVQATRRIAQDERLQDVAVLVLTTFADDEHVFEALRSGACGFLLKDGDPSDLLRAVRAVAAGQALLAPSVARRLIEEFAAWPERLPAAASQLGELTPREREVLALVAYGLTNAEIAERLVVSPATAKTHVSRTMMKLGAHERAQLVVLAYQTGLVTVGPAAGRAAGVAG